MSRIMLKGKDNMNDSITRGIPYKALDFFMVRTPILPISMYTDLFPDNHTNKQELEEYSTSLLVSLFENKIVREAIAVSSPSLLEALSDLHSDDNGRKRKQVLNGYMRYLLRMMSRATPFGLFSGVTYGGFGKQSQLKLKELDSYRKRARPDMAWLLKLIELVENQPGVIMQLRVQRNQLILRQGDRASIPYKISYGNMEQGENDSVSIRASAVFAFIMNETEEPILYSDLIGRVHSQFNDASREIVLSYVQELYLQEFLISELRPPTTITTPLEHIIAKLESVTGIDSIKSQLFEIYTDIERYNKIPIGQGEEQLLLLQKKMRDLVDIKNTLQIDLSLEDRSIVLTQDIREEVERIAGLFAHLSRIQNQYMDDYRMEFLEKYGPYREVPLLDLLDPEIGLGAPATYNYPPSTRKLNKNPKINKQKQLLFQWFVSCINKGQNELLLTDDMIQQLLEDEQQDDNLLLPSIELYFLINAKNQNELDQGNYTLSLGPAVGSYGAGKSFGRFIDLFDPSFRNEKFQIINQLEQKLSPEKLFAEVSFLPPLGTSSNVLLTDNFRDYEIALGANHNCPRDQQIRVSDLVVGVRKDRFYFKSKRFNKEVVPKAGHMYNYELTPNVYRFLIEASQDGHRTWHGLNLDFIFSSPFTPRLKYHKTVLSPATWNIHWDLKDKSKNVKQVQPFVLNFNEEWNVPRYVFITESDNRILLDLDHPLHIDQICNKLINSGHVVLTEHIGGFDETVIQRDDGCLTAEFVFPLVHVKSDQENENKEKANDNSLSEINLWSIGDEERTHLPGSKWFYAKLYGLNSRQDEFIGLYWNDFVKECKDNGIIKQAYFVRYGDPDVHIRARFEMIEQSELSRFIPLFYAWTTELWNKKLITRITIDTYEQELERYGGAELMNIVEHLHSVDSELVAELIQLIRSRHIETDIEIVAVVSVIEILYQFGLNLHEIYEFLNRYFDRKEYLSEFRDNRTLIMSLLNGFDSEKEKMNTDKPMIYQTLKIREDNFKYYYTKVLEKEQLKELINEKEDITLSVIHMHLNRLLGTDRTKERRVMILARHSINSLFHYRRKKYGI